MPYLVMSLLLLERLLLESRVTESVVEMSVGVRVVLSTSETSAISCTYISNIARLRHVTASLFSRDRKFISDHSAIPLVRDKLAIT